jgi:predicted aspartyl protease
MRALLLVPVKIDRQGPFRFVLDTGSTAAVVSNAVAQRLRLRSIGTRGLGAGGSFAARTSVAASMQVAGSTRYAVLLGVTDLGAISHATGMRIDGLLGYTFLQPYEVTIDYPHHRLCLRVPR